MTEQKNSLAEKWKKFEISDVTSHVPTSLCTVSYGKSLNVDLGNELKPSETQTAPTISWTADEKSLYTVIMTDPDAPSRKNPKFREWRHWLVVNVPGSDVTKGETIAAYMGPGPPQNTSLHRYIFLIYKQAEKVDKAKAKTGNNSDERGKWKAQHFVDTFVKNATLVAGNFFQAQHE
eukprot:TRINITY_DN207_c0_g1_i2.p1 TRINITY_DN207_c0_g1~~TRINITY_DN207_c0_g1_i2.p1  ORF type:complete len:196 (-),score=46.12 TRINITY_DN207_c0_g1_i2:203-733(-)